jgi:hypothetical protein
MSKVTKYHFEVEYRTIGGSSHSWDGYAEDEGDAISKALNESYTSWCNDDHFHSTISVWNNEEDSIIEEE